MVKKVLSKGYLYLLLAMLYLPILLIIVYSFSNTSNFSWKYGFSFGAYASIFTSSKTPLLMSAIKNTFIIAIISSAVSTVLGTAAAIGIYNLKKSFRQIVENVNQLPLINSEIVMAVALLVFYTTFSFPNDYTGTMARLILGHISFCTPYVVLSVLPRLQQMDPNIYEAALDLGASPSKAMVKVILPIIFPGIVSGGILAFTISMDDFIITQINKGANTTINTLSTYIYSDARVKGLEPFWFAVFSIIFIVVLTAVLVINLKNSKKGAMKENEKNH